MLRQQLDIGDWDQLLDAVKPWDVSGCIATDRNRCFQAELKGLGASSFYVMRLNLNRRLHQNGQTPRGFQSFAVMTTSSTPARFRRQDAFSRIGITPGYEFEGSSEPGFDVILFGFRDDVYRAWFNDREHPLADLAAFGNEMLESDVVLLSRFERLVDGLLESKTPRADLEQNESLVVRALLAGLEEMVVMKREARGAVPSTVARRRALNRGLEFIEGNLKNVLSISEICGYAAASERTLEYAFREYCGVTPKAYLNARRLHAFRQLLRGSKDRNVADVAGEFGYWHMGKLAADYRAIFGELPSETLRGSPDRASG